MVRNCLPKTVFVGSDVPHLRVYDAVSHFNIGASASIKTQEKMGISTVMVSVRMLVGRQTESIEHQQKVGKEQKEEKNY